MSVADIIREKLTAALAPTLLEIEDQSESHRGHGGYREGGETHFHVEIVSAAFDGMTQVARHRRIYDLLQAEIDAGIHALSLTTRTPDPKNAG